MSVPSECKTDSNQKTERNHTKKNTGSRFVVGYSIEWGVGWGSRGSPVKESVPRRRRL